MPFPPATAAPVPPLAISRMSGMSSRPIMAANSAGAGAGRGGILRERGNCGCKWQLVSEEFPFYYLLLHYCRVFLAFGLAEL